MSRQAWWQNGGNYSAHQEALQECIRQWFQDKRMHQKLNEQLGFPDSTQCFEYIDIVLTHNTKIKSIWIAYGNSHFYFQTFWYLNWRECWLMTYNNQPCCLWFILYSYNNYLIGGSHNIIWLHYLESHHFIIVSIPWIHVASTFCSILCFGEKNVA